MKKHDKSYKQSIHETLKDLCQNSGTLVLGLTGGIATGKSTVSEFFRELGAVIIDFDVLARDVVEPGGKSWKMIVDYFGDNILDTDNSLNRKKLSDIVFSDHLKREKLESFTHPYIWDEFLHQVHQAILEDVKCTILAVVPLLIEGDMQKIFSRNIAVYAPPDIQIKRLMERDKINRDKAKNILASQMSIDDKIHYVDFVIKNDGPIDKTKEKVRILWETFKKVRRQNQTDQS